MHCEVSSDDFFGESKNIIGKLATRWQTLCKLDEMDLDREVKKLPHAVRLHKSFKSQKNGDISLSRNVLRWGRKGINNRI
jgi:hypothetical protein